MGVVLAQKERVFLGRADARISRAINIEASRALLLALASTLQMRLAILNELLLIRQLLAQSIRTDIALVSLTLSANGLPTFL